MNRPTRVFVSALLPILTLVFCHGCSGGASKDAVQAAAPSSAPAVVKNQAPTIKAIGDEVAKIGETFDYQPVAQDPDGDALRFSAENLPPWASIDPTNGRMSGTPGPSDEGVYESITIIVADAARKTVSAPFSITVLGDAGTGSASLRWELPPSKVDGSPLDDLAGYRILYGRNGDDLDKSVLIDDPSVTSFEISGLQSGIWYFAVVAVNAGGLEGPPTIVTMKSI